VKRMANRSLTLQDYHQRVNKVLHYINTHLDEKIDLEKLAQLSNFSPYHFHRIMRAYLNESLMSYIVRIRLDNAACLIQTTDLPITEIAYKVGYDVPSSLNKAFKKRFHVSPTEYKEHYRETNGINYLKLSKMKSKSEMKPKFTELKEKQVIYVSSIGPYSGQGTEEAWRKVCDFAEQKKLFGWKAEFIGISHDDPKVTESEKLRYDACVTVSKEVNPEGEVGIKTIIGGKYAVFLHKGPYSEFQGSYDYIYGVWLPESNCELRDEPCFEKYLNSPDKTRPENLKTEIYIPIQ
jgi:AraC family transcriptional regulator